MSKKDDELSNQLLDQKKRLEQQIEELQTLDLDAILATTTGRGRGVNKKTTPDWVLEYRRKNNTNGPTRHIVKTDKETGETQKILPVVVPPVKERPPIGWVERPTDDGSGTTRQALIGKARFGGLGKLVPNVGDVLDPLRDEGPTKPMRKQMLAMNKVWKYRNFKFCLHCSVFYTEEEAIDMGEPKLAGKVKRGVYDTWESRTKPYADDLGPRQTHAEIWCHECGATDLEVAEKPIDPNKIGSWSPPAETAKQQEIRIQGQIYRRGRATFSLVQKPKTAIELCVWFRTVEKYQYVDVVMLELMLKRMQREGLVVFSGGKWWDKEDYHFEKSK